ncbi:hypothetical protein LHK12_21800 [Providencia rettgeri]|nr:hypothetical protein [Providencia rettgeri]
MHIFSIIKASELSKGCHQRRKREVKLSPVQQAFVENFSFQCGYCTPGFVNAATVFIEELQRNPIAEADLEEAIKQALNNHICRCTGYVRYYEAVRDVVLATPGLIKEAVK